MTILIAIQLIEPCWSRTHKAHSTSKHIEELRKFVKAVPAQEPTERRDPWIVDDLECRSSGVP